METEKKSLTQRAILVSLNTRQCTFVKKNKKIGREVVTLHNADADAGDWYSRLIPKSELKALQAKRDRCSTVHMKYTLPWFGGGIGILPATRFLKYSTEMRKAITEHDAAVDDFADRFETILAERKSGLGDTVEGMVWPTKGEIKSRFRVWFDIQQLADNDFRVEMADEMAEEVREQVSKSNKALLRHAMKDVWKQFSEVVAKIVNATENERKVFHDTTFTGLRNFCDIVLPQLNLTDDEELEECRQEAIAKLSSLAPDDVRTDKNVRKQANKAAKDVLEKMSGYFSQK